jgi:hypothetical protein
LLSITMASNSRKDANSRGAFCVLFIHCFTLLLDLRVSCILISKKKWAPLHENKETESMESEMAILSPHPPRPPLLVHACTQHTIPHPPHTHVPHDHVNSGSLLSDASDQVSCFRRDHETRY